MELEKVAPHKYRQLGETIQLKACSQKMLMLKGALLTGVVEGAGHSQIIWQTFKFYW